MQNNTELLDNLLALQLLFWGWRNGVEINITHAEEILATAITKAEGK